MTCGEGKGWPYGVSVRNAAFCSEAQDSGMRTQDRQDVVFSDYAIEASGCSTVASFLIDLR